ncbi:MAG: helix-hairpin-helix domain-containing protein, partial [Candidatus Omnitrophota bacterium]
KNDKVDSVGACVGMRGNRVKNIVNELQGEKIDIVRYNDDIKEYIKAALSPAKVSEIKLNKEALKAEVIVDDDQLSLAIGKHGQNVRLASRIVGWELDIRTKVVAVAAKEEKEQEAEQAPLEKKEKKAKREKKEKPKGVDLTSLPGVGEKTVAALKEAGFKTIDDIARGGIEDLTKVKGVGQKKAQKLIEEARKLVKI